MSKKMDAPTRDAFSEFTNETNTLEYCLRWGVLGADELIAASNVQPSPARRPRP